MYNEQQLVKLSVQLWVSCGCLLVMMLLCFCVT